MWSCAEPTARATTPSAAASWRSKATRYRLVGSWCPACQQGFLPPRRVCPECRNRKLEERAFARTGTVITAAVDHTPLIGHAGRATRPLAVVQLDDGPAVTSELVDVGDITVEPGTAVEMVIRKWRREATGLYHYGYKFRPRSAS